MSCSKTYNVSKVYISTLDRSYQTARQLFGEREFAKTDLINEVPLRSAFDTKKKLPLWFWNVTGRLQWLCNSNRQPETKRQTNERAKRFVQELINNAEDCTIVTHGFFMHTLISEMKRSGFRPDKTSLSYQNGEAIKLYY
ncbi:histidine phosphatase family protein [Butyrivibrio sp.]|uniref:histidine phosphatase family protein n=1 Tax=Butyrivibrio sp. TaxID=28121 RepID=UPI003FA41387